MLCVREKRGKIRSLGFLPFALYIYTIYGRKPRDLYHIQIQTLFEIYLNEYVSCVEIYGVEFKVPVHCVTMLQLCSCTSRANQTQC